MKLAVFHHARLEGGSPFIDPNFGRGMFQAQMGLLVASGLYENANRVVVGLNGAGGDWVREEAPPGVEVVEHGAAVSLLPTFLIIEEWVKSHPDWMVCVWHMKGVTHPGDYLNYAWRRCMEKAVIEGWQSCVDALRHGYDSAGAHWLTREQYGSIVNTFFWGGAFFWAKAAFLASLPPLPREIRTKEDWFAPEMWIGTGRRPMVKDFCPHWPGIDACSKSI